MVEVLQVMELVKLLSHKITKAEAYSVTFVWGPRRETAELCAARACGA